MLTRRIGKLLWGFQVRLVAGFVCPKISIYRRRAVSMQDYTKNEQKIARILAGIIIGMATIQLFLVVIAL